jgi:hypothetical protein
VSYFTLRTIIVLMETMKDFYSSTHPTLCCGRAAICALMSTRTYSRRQLFANAAIAASRVAA